MNINGLQKLSLLDFPGKTACTVFLAGCDMRCPFCHNSELIEGNAEVVMDDQELLKFLKGRQGLLDGVAFTGGEPLLRKELPQLFRDIKALGYAIKLDTNGNHPDALKVVLDEKLVDYVAMDIKNSPEMYPETTGTPNFTLKNVKKSIDLIMNSGIAYEFRTTVVNELHNDESFEGIGKLIENAENYFLQAFVDRDSVIYSGFSTPSKENLEKYREIVLKYVKNAKIRGVD